MTTVSIHTPTIVAAPRGALWAAQLAHAVWRTLSRGLQSRSASSADAPSRLQRMREAAAVRRMADELRQVDARFAADLYAAADRHLR